MLPSAQRRSAWCCAPSSRRAISTCRCRRVPVLPLHPTEARRLLEQAGFVNPSHRTLPLAWQIEDSDVLLGIFLEGGVRTRALLRAQTPEAMISIREALRAGAREFERGSVLDLPTPAVLSAGIKP